MGGVGVQTSASDGVRAQRKTSHTCTWPVGHHLSFTTGTSHLQTFVLLESTSLVDQKLAELRKFKDPNMEQLHTTNAV